MGRPVQVEILGSGNDSTENSQCFKIFNSEKLELKKCFSVMTLLKILAKEKPDSELVFKNCIILIHVGEYMSYVCIYI